MYNQKMPGVDLGKLYLIIGDQMKANRKVARVRVKKFYKKLFMHFFDIALINAYILSKHIPGRRVDTHATFRLKLIEQIQVFIRQPVLPLAVDIIPSSIPSSSPFTNNNDSSDYDTDTENDGNFTPSNSVDFHYPQTRNIRQQCRYCYRKKTATNPKIVNKTTYFCSLCRKYFCLTNGRNCYHLYREQLEKDKDKAIRGIRVNNFRGPDAFCSPATGDSFYTPNSQQSSSRRIYTPNSQQSSSRDTDVTPTQQILNNMKKRRTLNPEI
jgi:hypothetical protein